ncbi:BnaC03g64950D [Brassica napus]|uniref:BnaC03g64950D protein n=2 Tax=Brassica TaxID=3705 RepID=A0A078GLI3_BRANA|nr:BnaC03g64950D [Brassica napus]VDC99752.1 unnamed protein product [Brassica oleracea]
MAVVSRQDHFREQPQTTSSFSALCRLLPPRQDHFHIPLRRLCLPRRVRRDPQPRQSLITTVIQALPAWKDQSWGSILLKRRFQW